MHIYIATIYRLSLYTVRKYTTSKTETIRLRKVSVYKERLSFKVRYIRGVVKLTGVRRTRLRVNKERQVGTFSIHSLQTGMNISNAIV